MASFTAYLHIGPRVYRVVWCSYSFWQWIDGRGRPISKVGKGPIYIEIDISEDLRQLEEWAAADAKVESGRLVFIRSDSDSASHHVWFQDAYCVNYLLDFLGTGMRQEGALRAFFTLSPSDMGRESGNGEDWVAPAPRAYETKLQAADTQSEQPKSVEAIKAATEAGKTVKKSVSEELGYKAGSLEHKAAQREFYLIKKAAVGEIPKDYAKWEKSYYTVINNNRKGYADEATYRRVFGGTSSMLKTKFTKRQIDIYREDEDYCGQLKTGYLYFGKQEKIDLQKDEWLIRERDMIVEYILEKGGSKPLIEALAKIGAKITIGRQI